MATAQVSTLPVGKEQRSIETTLNDDEYAKDIFAWKQKTFGNARALH